MKKIPSSFNLKVVLIKLLAQEVEFIVYCPILVNKWNNIYLVWFSLLFGPSGLTTKKEHTGVLFKMFSDSLNMKTHQVYLL